MKPIGLAVPLMAAGALTIPIVDALIKLLAVEHGVVVIAWARYLSTLVFVLPLVLALEGRRALAPRDLKLHALRAAFMVGAMTSFIMALAAVPITTALGGLFLSPLIGAALSIVLLGERPTWGRIGAVVAGFGGAMAVLQPGGAMPLAGLWALVAGALWAGYVVCARLAGQGRDSSLVALATQNALAALALTPVALATGIDLRMQDIGLVGAMGLVSAFSHLMMLAALRRAEASALAPLMYLELVTATALGLILFGDWPNALAWFGIAVVVGAGLSVQLAGAQTLTSTIRARTS